MNHKKENELLAATLRFKPASPPIMAEVNVNADAANFLADANTGHPGVKVSLAQAGDVRIVYGASDTRQLRDAYDEADVSSFIANSNVLVLKSE